MRSEEKTRSDQAMPAPVEAFARNDRMVIKTPLFEHVARHSGLRESGFSWIEARLKTKGPVTLPMALPGAAQPQIFITLPLSGAVGLTLEGIPRRTISPDTEYFARRARDGSTIMLDVTKPTVATTFVAAATPKTLTDWFGGNVPADLRELLSDKLDHSVEMPMMKGQLFRHMTATIADIAEPLLPIAAEGLAMQALSVFLNDMFRCEIHETSLSAREIRAVRDAHALLVADLQNPPTRAELALYSGLSERRLDQGFKDVFGTSIYRTIANARLDHARQALLDGGVSVKELAFRLGYKHPSNFSLAFRERFGTYPTQAKE